ncbi:MAG: STAS domain-containing protein [Lachnospiraceae bacterium]|nr:STAS domain-containing protein [Lachnospiraceae bacterium]MCD7841367.1 STAS domain-containing protein [Lachnospiraceae bacterium]
MGEQEKYLWVRLPREVDHYHVSALGRKVDEQLFKKPVECLVFDFEETEFMDSSGIGLVMGRFRTLKTFGGRMFLTHENIRIRRLFQESGVYDFAAPLADTESGEEI